MMRFCATLPTFDSRFRLVQWATFAIACISFSATAFSQNSSTVIEQIGILNHWKLGHSCNVRIAIPEAIRSRAAAVAITTLDGDGVEVVYRRQITDRIAPTVDLPIRIGREKSIISAAVVDQHGETIVAEDKDLTETVGLSATQPLVLCVGSSMGLEDLVRVSADETARSLSIVKIENAESLPSTWLQYQPCSLVVISTADIGLLRRIDTQQWHALDQWVRRGGGCIVSLGGKAEDVQSLDKLKQFLPGEVLTDARITSPAALESMIITEQQLQPFPAIQIDLERGNVQLSLKDSLSRQVPWWVTSQHGQGTVQFIASDLSHASFSSWKQRKSLWERLVAPYIDKSLIEGSQSEQSASTSYLGYSDLMGQLRASLDLFQGVSSVGFSQVAGVLLGILLLIGPLDYFVSVKWLKRPHLSWPFAGVVLLICAAGLSWYYHRLRPDQVISNTIQIVDIDIQTGQTDGHIWTHVYSAHARPVNVSTGHSIDRPYPVSTVDSTHGAFIDWQGLPGKGLGGLQSQLTFNSGIPAYTVDILEGQTSQLQSVGIPAAGTKSIYGTYSHSSKLTNSSSLRELGTVDQLEGELVNPLDVDLKDVTLFYHRWFYPLSSRLPAGHRFQLSSQVIPKDIVRRLNKQQEIDGKASSVRWDPAERGNLDRLIELMMFHTAATGRNYSNLTHNYQNIVDHSALLECDCAILIGRLESPAVRLKIEPTEPTDQPEITTAIDRAWCRIIIPVDTGRELATQK